MNEKLRIVIRADGNEKIGMGHIMRCFSIAQSLRSAGHTLCFLLSPDSDVHGVRSLGIPTQVLQRPVDSLASAEEILNWLAEWQANVLLVDSYRVTPELFAALHGKVRLAYLDDHYTFDYAVDVLINYNLEAKLERYPGSDYPHRKNCFGPRYFPLRSEIRQWKCVPRRGEAKSLLLATGATDPCDAALHALRALHPAATPACVFRVLIGAYYSARERAELEKYAAALQNVVLLPWGQDMGQLYASCDLFVGPGSTMIYEALSVGVPCISFQFVPGHRVQCTAMEERGLVPFVGDFRQDTQGTQKRLWAEWQRMRSGMYRKAYYEKFSTLFDGKGAARVAAILCDGIKGKGGR